MHRMSFLREQYMHRCILSPFSEMLHAKAVGTAPSGNATVVCLERESHVFADDNQTILEICCMQKPLGQPPLANRHY